MINEYENFVNKDDLVENSLKVKSVYKYCLFNNESIIIDGGQVTGGNSIGGSPFDTYTGPAGHVAISTEASNYLLEHVSVGEELCIYSTTSNYNFKDTVKSFTFNDADAGDLTIYYVGYVVLNGTTEYGTYPSGGLSDSFIGLMWSDRYGYFLSSGYLFTYDSGTDASQPITITKTPLVGDDAQLTIQGDVVGLSIQYVDQLNKSSATKSPELNTDMYQFNLNTANLPKNSRSTLKLFGTPQLVQASGVNQWTYRQIDVSNVNNYLTLESNDATVFNIAAGPSNPDSHTMVSSFYSFIFNIDVLYRGKDVTADVSIVKG